jgi:hypothetical protein
MCSRTYRLCTLAHRYLIAAMIIPGQPPPQPPLAALSPPSALPPRRAAQGIVCGVGRACRPCGCAEGGRVRVPQLPMWGGRAGRHGRSPRRGGRSVASRRAASGRGEERVGVTHSTRGMFWDGLSVGGGVAWHETCCMWIVCGCRLSLL